MQTISTQTPARPGSESRARRFAAVPPSLRRFRSPQPAGPAGSGAEADGRSAPDGRQPRSLLEELQRSKVYQEYERAFTEATGLPLSLQPTEAWQLANHGKRNESPLCAILARKSRSCAVCLQMQLQLTESATERPLTLPCAAGLCESAVPVRVEGRLLGFLRTGQVVLQAPTPGQFDRLCKLVAEWEVPADVDELRDAYFGTPAFTAEKYESMIRLLSVFAEQLGLLAHQLVVRQQNAEPPVITRAKEFIRQNYAEELSLAQVARSVNTSPFYFCKVFKKLTGINFTDYLSRVRIDKAKNLLLNPNLQISEIAFEVGFQSLTHFNRTFRRLVGKSPSEYRTQMPAA